MERFLTRLGFVVNDDGGVTSATRGHDRVSVTWHAGRIGNIDVNASPRPAQRELA